MDELREIVFHVSGEQHTVKIDDVSPQTTLNTYLRDMSHLTGTKRMCLEGGCGSCIVAVEEIDPKTSTKSIFAVNSCLVSILSCHGWRIITIEGIGGQNQNYHPIQKLLAHHNGTQCGFCSPGMVMNMYALTNTGPLTQQQIENSFGGNICRCTGYRPILEAFKTLASNDKYKICPDIEDYNPCFKKDCSISCEKQNSFVLKLTNNSQWVKVYTLDDLLRYLKTIENKTYMLVAGNTAQGVYKPISISDFYIDVSKVEELRSYSLNDDSLTLGANLSLTKSMQCFNDIAKNNKFSYLKKLADHIDLVANVPIRNIGTLAGNLMIKYYHNEFPSDIFLILETVNATLVIVDLEGNETRISPANFLNIDMNKKIIKEIILTNLDDTYKYGSFKIMPKAQNSHALVNAGFLFHLNNNTINNARIIFGCINKEFVHALNTEMIIKSQNIFDNNVLQEAFKSLDDELKTDTDLLETPAEFRKQLAISLFYKFILRIASDDIISPINKSGGTLLQRQLSSGHQEFGTNPNIYPVTKPILKLEALAQTSGQAEYIADIPDRPKQLFASFVLAKSEPNSIITSVDPSEALKLKGVVAFFDKNHIPGKNTFMPKNAGNLVEEEVFCSGRVQYFDQPVGIIVADSFDLAEKASDMIKITYKPPQTKPYLNIRDVLKVNDKSRIKHETAVLPKTKGNDVKHTIKGEMYIDKQYHMHMEVQCCNIIPTEDGLDIYASTQWMDMVQMGVAAFLDIPASRINILIRRLGGGFGGKIARNGLVTVAASLAAFKLNKPVKMWLTLQKNMTVIGKRFPLYVNYEVGTNDTGVIQYLDANLYSDFGIGGNETIEKEIIDIFPNIYNSDTWNYSTFTVSTDTHANCWTRGPGKTEGCAAIEHIFDDISYSLGLDPLEVRLANTNVNRPLGKKYLLDLQEWSDITKRKNDIEAFNKLNRWKKRGLSVLPLAWPLGVAANYSVLVSIFHGDGSVAVIHGGVEIGQGINTKVCQVVAYKFNIPMEKISIKPSYSSVTPNCLYTGSSLTSEAICYATIQACDVLLDRIKPIREKMKNPAWDVLIKKCYEEYILLCATAPYVLGNIPVYLVYAACAAEVEVDILTGQHQVLRFDVIEDVGDSMNPLIDIGQLEGAIIMGIGYYTTEAFVNDEQGQILTNRTWNYYVPGPKDIPIEFRIKFPSNNPNPVGVLHSKAIAEPPLCLTFAVPLAIRNAVSSARIDADISKPKWYPVYGCSTVDNTFMNCLNKYTQYTL